MIVHGYDLGVAHHGGYAQVARVPAGWVVPLPDGLAAREAMLVGTAGYTAALSVLALLDHGITPDAGTVLVTGATGGVGSMAVAMLAGLGFTVAASTGKPEAEPFLRGLGASTIVDRGELSRGRQAAAEAGVGRCGRRGRRCDARAACWRRLAPFGAVAASGNVGGADLPTTVLPFILRGVTLYGIDSANTPIDRRREVWGRIATDLKPAGLDGDGAGRRPRRTSRTRSTRSAAAASPAATSCDYASSACRAAQAGKGSSPIRARTSGRRRGGTVFGG